MNETGIEAGMVPLSKVYDGVRVQGVLPIIEPELTGMVKATISQAMGAIAQKKLTHEAAYQLWMEIWSTETLRRRLNTRVKMGQTAGESIEPALNPPKDG